MGLLSPTSLFQNAVKGGWGLMKGGWNLAHKQGNAWQAIQMGTSTGKTAAGGKGVAGKLGSIAGGVMGIFDQKNLLSGRKKKVQSATDRISAVSQYIGNVANIPGQCSKRNESSGKLQESNHKGILWSRFECLHLEKMV